MENKLLICPDTHCRSFYKPVLQVKDKPIVFLGDHMDPYRFEGTNDEDGIANLEEIFNFARNNKNVVLLAGNHDCSFLWSFMGWERTKYRYYQELHRLYRDNADLFKGAHKVDNFLFTHAGVCNGWVYTKNHEYEVDESDFRITQDNIVDYINNEFENELKEEYSCGKLWDAFLHSDIFNIGWSRGGSTCAGGPFWCDFNDDYKDPEGWTINQVFGHTLYDASTDDVAETGIIRQKGLGYCLDSKAIFELDLDTKKIERYAV